MKALPVSAGRGPRPWRAHQLLLPLGKGERQLDRPLTPAWEGRGGQKGESGRGKSEAWEGGFWVGFPGRFEAEQAVHRVMSYVTRGLWPKLSGIKIKTEWPETFPFLDLFSG